MKIQNMVRFGALAGLAVGVASTQSLAAVVAYYSFDDSANLGKDNSNNGFDLTASGGPTAVAGSNAAVGGAVSFDGVDDIFTRAASDIYANTPNLSISFWVKPTTVASGVNISRTSKGGTEGVNIYTSDTSGAGPITYRASIGASGTLNSGLTEVAGTYVFETITFQATGVADANGIYPGTDQIYINGTLVSGTNGTRTTAGYMPAANTSIFGLGGQANANHFFGGTLDEFAVYNQVLNQGQVTDLYNKRATPLTVVPEPAMLGVAAFGGLFALARRRRSLQ